MNFRGLLRGVSLARPKVMFQRNGRAAIFCRCGDFLQQQVGIQWLLPSDGPQEAPAARYSFSCKIFFVYASLGYCLFKFRHQRDSRRQSPTKWTSVSCKSGASFSCTSRTSWRDQPIRRLHDLNKQAPLPECSRAADDHEFADDERIPGSQGHYFINFTWKTHTLGCWGVVPEEGGLRKAAGRQQRRASPATR